MRRYPTPSSNPIWTAFYEAKKSYACVARSSPAPFPSPPPPPKKGRSPKMEPNSKGVFGDAREKNGSYGTNNIHDVKSTSGISDKSDQGKVDFPQLHPLPGDKLGFVGLK